jgi:hypothetical protein
MECHVVWQIFTVSEELAASIFTAKEQAAQEKWSEIQGREDKD